MIQTSIRKRRWLPWVVAIVALLLLGMAGFVALALYVLDQFGDGDPLGTTLVDTLTREQVEKAAGFGLPPSADGLHSHYASFQDYILHARFEIDPSDLPALTASLPITNPTMSTTERPLLYSEGMPDWWRPEQAQRFQAISGQVTLPAGYPESLTVLIDQTDPGRYTVYVVAFDT